MPGHELQDRREVLAEDARVQQELAHVLREEEQRVHREQRLAVLHLHPQSSSFLIANPSPLGFRHPIFPTPVILLKLTIEHRSRRVSEVHKSVLP